MGKYPLVFMVFLFLGQVLHAQVGNDCSSAVPICNNTPTNGGTDGFGIDDFNGVSRSGCLEQTTSGAIESNSAWYRFRTGASGQLGFNIGHDPMEDWDFALYQSDDCGTLGEPIRCNFFDNSDQRSYTGVGEDPSGSASVNYEEWLEVNPGEDYYLLINNFSNVNSGFSIQFSGEIFTTNPNDALDCSIVSNLLGPPQAACENEIIVLDATTAGAMGYNWYSDTGAGFQPISGLHSNTLNVTYDALYRVEVLTSSGTIISDVQVAFSTAPIAQPFIDETICHNEGDTFDLTIKDFEVLGTQNPDEFTVSYHLSSADAVTGANAISKSYLKDVGLEVIHARVTSLANPNCYDASQSFTLNALPPPELAIETEVFLCDNSLGTTIGETLPHPGYSYQWDTGETSPDLYVSQGGEYTLTVTDNISGMGCSSTETVHVVISSSPSISDIEIGDLQTSNTVTVLTEAEGQFEYQLDNGAFQSGNVFSDVLPGAHTVSMRDVLGCGIVTENIVVVGFLNHFSPNGDSLNESWQIEELSTLNDPIVTIYDRYGKLIVQLSELNSSWDGTFNGKPLPATDYWFKLSYIDNNGIRTYAKYLQNHFSLRR